MDGVTGSKNQDAVEALPEPQTSLKEGRPKLTVTLNWRRTWTPQGCRPHSHTMQGAWAYPSDCFKVSYSTEEMKTVGGCSSNQNWPKPEWSKIGSGRGFCVCADEQRRSRESGGPDGDSAHLPVPRRAGRLLQTVSKLRALEAGSSNRRDYSTQQPNKLVQCGSSQWLSSIPETHPKSTTTPYVDSSCARNWCSIASVSASARDRSRRSIICLFDWLCPAGWVSNCQPVAHEHWRQPG